MPEGHVVAEHRHRAGQGGGVRPEPADTHPERAADSVGHERAGASQQLLGAEVGLLGQGSEQLLDEERVTGRGVPADLGQPGIHTGTEDLPNQLADRLAPQGGQVLDPDLGVARQGAERIGGRLVRAGPPGHHDGRGEFVEPMKDVEEKLNRSAV